MFKFYTIVLVGWLSFPVAAQVRMEISGLTPLPLPEGSLYLASELNGWNAGDPAYLFEKDSSGNYYLELKNVPDHFEYKITQGSWNVTEGDEIGGVIPNRVYRSSLPPVIPVKVSGWEKKLIYNFVVEHIPANTPHDATLYITGNFNNWHPGNPLYKLHPGIDGTWRVTIFTDVSPLKFKFTRGNWQSVEGRSSGKAMPNRYFRPIDSEKNNTIAVEIEGWEDLTATFNFYSLYDLLLLLSVFQGILLIIAIPTIQDYNKAANRWLVITIAVASFLIGMRVLGSYRPVSETFTKILLIPDLVLFLYAPLFYCYLQKLLFNQTPGSARQFWHFIPSLLQLFAYLPFFLLSDRALQLDMLNQDRRLVLIFLASGLLGLAWNTWYWFSFRATLRFYKAQFRTHFSYEQNLQYLNTVHVIQAVCLGIWLFLFVILGVGYGLGLEVGVIIERSVDAIWLVFSTITYFVGYYAIHQPEVFKITPQPFTVFAPAPEIAEHVKENIREPAIVMMEADEMEAFKETVTSYMQKSKLYTNPRLSLNELGEKLKMPVHTLSKVLNDGFGKNFFDFVNGYRVEEFKRRVENPRFKHYTLLSIAYEVGFNSKTAFNRSFKKITGQTPSEYYVGMSRVE